MRAKNDNAIFIGGNTGEAIVKNVILQSGLRFHSDIYLEYNDEVTQIDFIIVLNNSLACVEVKNYTKCSIQGDEHSRCWTASYRSGNKPVLNPINQNKKHIEFMKGIFGEIPIWNITVFSSGCNIHISEITDPLTKVVGLTDLWYILTDLKYSQNRGKLKLDTEKIMSILDSYQSRRSELYKKHQDTHFNNNK